MPQERIELHDTPMSAIAKLSEGNPGAVTVLVDLFKTTPSLDPDAAFGGVAPLFTLDTMGIYGSKIWVLFKDCCGSSILGLQTVLRAYQLGILRRYEIDEAMRDYTALDTTSLLASVQKELPRFGVAALPSDLLNA